MVHRFKQIWCPLRNGLSVSGLEMWLVDKTAFEISYLRDLEVVEGWNKNTQYGTFVQAGIEGYIKHRDPKLAAFFIQKEFEKQIKQYEDYEDICWWAQLAQSQVQTWIDLYAKDLDTYGITRSEVHHKIDLELPSGRKICLHGYIDGEGDDILMENKCRGEWDEESIASEIDLNLQVNMYLLFHKARTGVLPNRVWYQHIRRPGGFAYRGPRKKAKESNEQYRRRLADAIDSDRDYHFYRYWVLPDEERFQRFTHLCLYPMLEAFLDWYFYMIHPNRKDEVNKYHWVTPYGLYNPFLEGTQERFRNFRLTGSTLGLRPKVHYR